MRITKRQSRQQRSGTTPRVSLRTLILTLELLVAVVALQYVAASRPAQASAIWLANDRPATLSAPAEAGANPIAP